MAARVDPLRTGVTCGALFIVVFGIRTIVPLATFGCAVEIPQALGFAEVNCSGSGGGLGRAYNAVVADQGVDGLVGQFANTIGSIIGP